MLGLAVAARPVNIWVFPSHRPDVATQLASVVDHVEQHDPRCESQWSFKMDLFPDQEPIIHGVPGILSNSGKPCRGDGS